MTQCPSLFHHLGLSLPVEGQSFKRACVVQEGRCPLWAEPTRRLGNITVMPWHVKTPRKSLSQHQAGHNLIRAASKKEVLGEPEQNNTNDGGAGRRLLSCFGPLGPVKTRGLEADREDSPPHAMRQRVPFISWIPSAPLSPGR